MLRQIFKRGASCTHSALNARQGMLQLNRVAAYQPSRPTKAHFNGESAVFAESMYEQWKQDPSSVEPQWQSYFSGFEFGTGSTMNQLPDGASAVGLGSSDASQAQAEGFKLLALIRAYMTHGHFKADVDPLKLSETYGQGLSSVFKSPGEQYRKLLDIEHYGFTEADLDKRFHVHLPQWGGLLGQKDEWTLREVIETMGNAYCGKIGVEYMHIPDRHQCNWIREKVELRQFTQMTKAEKATLADRLFWADGFAQFIAQKFNTMKRFGLEGCEAFIPGMKTAMDALVAKGAQKAIIGMPHRGRLNVLANVVRKPLETIFAEFQGVAPADAPTQESHWTGATGDVKYHLGTAFTRAYEDGKELTVEVLANPSHLECINPVVMGRVRAEANIRRTLAGTNDQRPELVVPILVHGDASFAGQGVCYEQMQMQDLRNYGVGGTLHVVVNNQIGFTTVPMKGRSEMYATDLAKSINCPIFHVNADSMEDVHFVFKLAAEYRQKFKHDVVVDLIGYRKMGHNELDQPSFTQPLMYKQIAKMRPVARIYEEQLVKEGSFTQEELDAMKAGISKRLEDAYHDSKGHKYEPEEWVSEEWKNIAVATIDEGKTSGLPVPRLRETGIGISTLPAEDSFHRNVRKIFEARVKSFETGQGIDWGTAEALACATLIQDGYNVRISGQDVERGTFSHRHAHVFYQDGKDGYYNPINAAVVGKTAYDGPRRFIASNSHLSEFGVLGYELGYAQTHPNTLVMWEAQFGDFANGAQVIIDQFICSGEAKWHVKNGLVVLLPHGYDGAGPEHSSARTERFLLLCNQDDDIPGGTLDYDNKDVLERLNMQVVHPSTAANYFHLLRTQMRMPYRKPLIVIAPKKLLKFKGATSNIESFGEGTRWFHLLKDQGINGTPLVDADVKKVVLCSGQVYYDLEADRAKNNRTDVAIVRVESLCPFPFKEIVQQLTRYKNADDVVWAQEEPKNAGSWTYAQPRMWNIIEYLKRDKMTLTYAGRPIMAATAVGYTPTHNAQLAQLLKDAFE